MLAAQTFGEVDAVVTLLTEEHGACRGLARGARSRAGRAVWEIGNVVRVRWVGRLPDQLGTFAGEILQSPSVHLFDASLKMASLASTCAVAAGALPDRASHPETYAGLVDLLAGLVGGREAIPSVVRWEATLLRELGYGLDLARCAVTGVNDGLVFVSPRSGCAVSEKGAGQWRDKLLRLPGFLIDGACPVSAADCRDGLQLTGHFLARDAFGMRHQSLPTLRERLVDLVTRSR